MKTDKKKLKLIEEKKVKGFYYCWLKVLYADGRILKDEILAVESMIKTEDFHIADAFKDDHWKKNVMAEFYKLLNENKLDREIKEYFGILDDEEQRFLIESLYWIAISDGKFRIEEMDEINYLANFLDISKQNLLLASMFQIRFMLEE